MKKIIIANWKMNLTPTQSADLATELKENLGETDDSEVVICPSFSAMSLVSEQIKKSNLILGSQNISWMEKGAFTGEESVGNVQEFDCKYAIVGHSERRQNLGETDEMINKKISICLNEGITPIFCIGETFQEKQDGTTDHKLYAQIREGLKKIDLLPHENMVVAYEPIWAIGTGQAITPADAEKAFKLIYQNLIDLWPLTIVNNNVRIIYGGSVDENNSQEFAQIDMINGFLVGGASLNSDKFSQIIKNI
ncbi:MAG: triose-phosphate isomerase [Patescibacteria group bacterium]|jgi:triosephosphate isomerase